MKGYDMEGNEVALIYTDPDDADETKSIYSETSFYDAREGAYVTSIDVDVANMIESGIVPNNGILYVSNEDGGGNMGVVRMVNGAELPVAPGTTGFSVATDDPLYMQGDYNTVNKTLAMVASDALSILSNNWDDANSADYGSRAASVTRLRMSTAL